MSGAALFIKDDLGISDTQVEILIGILNLYSLLGSFAAGRTSDRIGRRYTIVFAAAIFFAGALLMGLATNYAFLMVGRFVAGVGVGYALVIAPVYTAKVLPASSRGFLTSFLDVFINIGILLGYVSNYAFARLPDRLGWRLMLGVGAVPAVCLAAGVLAMPESPRWLVMRGRLGEARSVLAKTSDTPDEAELQFIEIKETAGIPSECNGEVVPIPRKKSSGVDVWKELLLRPTPAARRALISAVGIHFFQQASGIDAVVLYSPRVFEKAGIRGKSSLLGATVAVGFTKTAFILVATFMLDRAGRRPLMLSSAGGAVTALVGLGAGLVEVERGAAGWAVGVCVASVLAYVSFFSVGLGPVTWVYSSEVLPLRMRASGASVGVAVNRLTSGVVTMTFISLYKAVGIGCSFFLYGGVAAAGWVFFFLYLVETRGRTLEEMEGLFGGKSEEKEKGGESQVQLADTGHQQA